jgi:hypothetical protein
MYIFDCRTETGHASFYGLHFLMSTRGELFVSITRCYYAEMLGNVNQIMTGVQQQMAY